MSTLNDYKKAARDIADDKPDELDYVANRLAKGSFPGNAKYIFNKTDWNNFKAEVATLIASKVKEARIDQTEQLIENAMQNSSVMGFVSSAKRHLTFLKGERTQ